MDTLDRSCSADAAVGFAPVGPPEVAAKEGKPPHPASQHEMTKKADLAPGLDAGPRHRVSRQRTGQATAERQKHLSAKKSTRRCCHWPRRTSERRRGGDCRASSCVVAQLKRLPRTKSLRGRSALVLTECPEIIPRHICSGTHVTCLTPTVDACTVGAPA